MIGWGRHEAALALIMQLMGEQPCIPKSVSEATAATAVMQDNRFAEPTLDATLPQT